MSYRLTFLLLLFSTFCLNAQVVYTEPAFPTQNDDITLFFDATKGSAGLKDYTGDVYGHMGLITNESNSPTDWKHVVGTWGTADPNTLFTRVGDNLYSKNYNITDFHDVPSSELVEKLAFVFRSADGNLSGRADDGSDIYLDVFPPVEGLFVTLLSPEENSIYIQGDEVEIRLRINKVADVTITDNGQEIFSGSTDMVETSIPANIAGDHELVITAQEGGDRAELTATYVVLENVNNTSDKPGWLAEYGVSYDVASDQYGFILTAPEKSNVFLLCPANEFKVATDFRMTLSENQEYFWIVLPANLFAGTDNLYQFLVEGKIKIADPYSEVVLDPWNDAWVPTDVLDLYPGYPEGITSGFVSVLDTDQEEYDWQVLDFERPEKTRLNIYELMMRDFLEDKNYKSLIDTISYLKNLGINAIEFMPVNEFEGNQSWGYNPSFHSAIDKYYGSQDQLRAVIDECHKQGIAVILDVVFNHAFSQSPLCQLYWDSANFRPADDNPWLNVIARHPYNVGYDFNHESKFTKAWVKAVLDRMIEDFKIDGFRFDLSKGLTQFDSGSNGSLMSQYDPTRVNILNDYAEHIWAHGSDHYVIMEHFAVAREEKELSNNGMMLWSNDTHQFAEAAMGYASNLNGANYMARGFNDPHVISYMESHDEERMGYKIKEWGNSSAGYDTKDFWTFPERIVATTAVYLSMPGPKMFWQFGELGYDFSIDRCEDGTINSGCRLSPKPVRWDFLENLSRKSIYDKTSALLHLRNSNEVFHTESFTVTDDPYFKRIKLNGDDMNVVTLANFNVSAMEVDPQFHETGEWYDYLTGEVLTVTDVNGLLNFEAGEYRIYTSKRIDPPNGTFTSTQEPLLSDATVFPNPVIAGRSFTILSDDLKMNSEVQLVSMDGKELELQVVAISSGHFEIKTSDATPQGLYVVNLKNEGVQALTKFLFIQ